MFFFLLTVLVCFFIFIVVMAFIFRGEARFSKEPVAVYKIEGPIFNSLDTLRDLEDLHSDDHIKVIVLRLDSPGGAVGPSQEIYEQILKIKKDKKVIVSMGTLAASGAYYIACASDKIVASSGTITGSIGVIMESIGLQDLAKTVQVETRVIKSGAYKDVGSPFRAMTESERVYLQNLTDNMYEQFVKAVSDNRKIPIEKMHELAQGRIYSGQQALEVGLVDQLGNIYDAIDLAKTLAGLPQSVEVRWPKEPTAFEKFFDGEKAQSLFQGFLQKMALQAMPLWYTDVQQIPKVTVQ